LHTFDRLSSIHHQSVVLFLAGLCSLVVVNLLTITAPHPQDPYMINVGLTPFTTTASALSLLLVFRTNASYGRWWEARKVSEPFASATRTESANPLVHRLPVA
jgi:predicted membrane chloride channel (bestrophin family)